MTIDWNARRKWIQVRMFRERFGSRNDWEALLRAAKAWELTRLRSK